MGDCAWQVTVWQVTQITVWDWGEENQDHILKIPAPRKNPAYSSREKKIYSDLIFLLCHDYLQSSSSAVSPSFSCSNLCGHFYSACQHSVWMSSKQEEIVTPFSPHQQNRDFISASMESSENVSMLRRGAWKFIMDTTPHSPVCFLLYLCIALSLTVTMGTSWCLWYL